MGDTERAGRASAIPAIKTSDTDAGTVAGEILDEHTERTEPPPGASEPRSDKVANARGMRPLTRP
jgi:hypothetical protein